MITQKFTMEMLNYSATTYVATPVPPTTHFYPPLLPQYREPAEQGLYVYPRPENPFLDEEYEPQRQQKKTNRFHKTTTYQEEQRRPHQRINHHQYDRQDSATPKPFHFTRTPPELPITTETTLHPVIDYDYFEEGTFSSSAGNTPSLPVTPIQGPIFLKNGSVPVVPLYSYPVMNNGTFVQIPVSMLFISLVLSSFFDHFR